MPIESKNESGKEMGSIKAMDNLDSKRIDDLVRIWESAVRETHTFLTEADIEALEPEVKYGLSQVTYLYCFYDEKDRIRGFIGVEGQKIEMLFVDAKVRGQGIGKQLLQYVCNNLNVNYVDVNEQNEQGVGFYNHMGFHIISRSAYDEMGRPFPILHLKRKRF